MKDRIDPTDQQSAFGAAVAVARRYGLRCDAAAVIGAKRSNVLVHLAPSQVVARVPVTKVGVCDISLHLAREVEIARELAIAGAPVAAPTDLAPPGPHRHDAINLSLWRFYDCDSRRLDPERTGHLLRELHRFLSAAQASSLSTPLADVDVALELAANTLSPADLSTLRTERTRIADALAGIDVSNQPLHGDAHFGNLLWTGTGPLWNDFEDVCFGPIEWDIACLAATAYAFGAQTELVDKALHAYGAVNRELTRLLLDLRVLQFTAWAAVLARRRTGNVARLTFWLNWLRKSPGERSEADRRAWRILDLE